jgi:hypothetical protein
MPVIVLAVHVNTEIRRRGLFVCQFLWCRGVVKFGGRVAMSCGTVDVPVGGASTTRRRLLGVGGPWRFAADGGDVSNLAHEPQFFSACALAPLAASPPVVSPHGLEGGGRRTARGAEPPHGGGRTVTAASSVGRAALTAHRAVVVECWLIAGLARLGGARG